MNRWNAPFNPQKNRGKKLEQRFKSWMKLWNQMSGVCAIRLHVERSYKGNIHKEKQPCDYLVIRSKGGETTVYFIDSKECASEKFYPKKKSIAHQRQAFLDAQRHGNQGGFVVWFTKSDPTGSNLRFITDMDSPATIDSGVRFEYSTFFGELSMMYEAD